MIRPVSPRILWIAMILLVSSCVVARAQQAATAAGSALAPPSGQGPGQVNRVLFRGTPEELSAVEKLLHQYDEMPREVLLEMFLLDVDVTRNDSVGITFSSLFGASRGFSNLPLGGYTFDRRLTDYDQQIRFGSLSTERFQLFLQYLKDLSDTRVLNRPSALVLDGGTAILNLGGQQLYTSGYGQVNTGSVSNPIYINVPQSSVLDTGQNLTLTPRIMPNDIILLSLTISDIALASLREGDPARLIPDRPVTNRRALAAPMFLKDKSAVVIGGLKSQRRIRASTKIPLLGDLPFLGKNFGRNTKHSEDNELVIVVRATVYSQDDFQEGPGGERPPIPLTARPEISVDGGQGVRQ